MHNFRHKGLLSLLLSTVFVLTSTAPSHALTHMTEQQVVKVIPGYAMHAQIERLLSKKADHHHLAHVCDACFGFCSAFDGSIVQVPVFYLSAKHWRLSADQTQKTLSIPRESYLARAPPR